MKRIFKVILTTLVIVLIIPVCCIAEEIPTEVYNEMPNTEQECEIVDVTGAYENGAYVNTVVAYIQTYFSYSLDGYRMQYYMNGSTSDNINLVAGNGKIEVFTGWGFYEEINGVNECYQVSLQVTKVSEEYSINNQCYIEQLHLKVGYIDETYEWKYEEFDCEGYLYEPLSQISVNYMNTTFVDGIWVTISTFQPEEATEDNTDLLNQLITSTNNIVATELFIAGIIVGIACGTTLIWGLTRNG